jgi:hypothetical protein
MVLTAVALRLSNRPDPQRLCFPRVSIGNRHMATDAARIKEPAAHTGALGLIDPAWIATMGAMRPQIRFNIEAIPVPVPRLGAGKTSGVYA